MGCNSFLGFGFVVRAPRFFITTGSVGSTSTGSVAVGVGTSTVTVVSSGVTASTVTFGSYSTGVSASVSYTHLTLPTKA